MSQRLSRGRADDRTAAMTWRERLGAVRYVAPFLRMTWQAHRGLACAVVILRLLRAVVPVATLWIGKLIIDAVVAARTLDLPVADVWNAPPVRHLASLVLLEIGIVLIGDLLARLSALTEALLGDLFANLTSIRLMQHAATLDLYQFENPDFYDRLERARRQTTSRIGLLAQLLSLAQDALTLISLCAGLVLVNGWLLVLLVASVLPGFWSATHFAALEYSLLYRWTPERRWLDYFRYLGASDKTAKEVQIFGLADWIINRYRLLSTLFYESNKRLAIRRSLVSGGLAMIGTLGYYAAYGLILWRAVTGLISLGSLTFLAASFARSRDAIERLLLGSSDILRQALYLKDLFDFFETRPQIISIPNAPPVPSKFAFGFTFENVGFRYPESERWAIRHLNFELRVGERIALVGENGAGKTTITKLLARLYDPTEGRILLDGRDLREYDVTSLRRAVSVIFQDFVRYDWAFDANIGVGEINSVAAYLDATQTHDINGKRDALHKNYQSRSNDKRRVDDSTATENPAHEALPLSHELELSNGKFSNGETTEVPVTIKAAADKSLASLLLPRFPDGYRQMLGRRFEGGVDLSGGEWQKVALARAYMRDAQVLILDEPTAALDARAEYEVFTRFSSLVAGRTAVLISHRFSTVRMADRILVLADGCVAESGTHDELVKHGGTYAELFNLQAKGYQ